MSKDEVQSFSEINKLLTKLNELVSNLISSALIILEFLSQKFQLFENVFQKELAPLSKLISFLPTNAPTVITGVQGGEKKSVGEGASWKTEDEANVVGKVFATNIPSTKPILSKAGPVVSTVTNIRQISKGIVIGTSGEWSALKPKEIPTN